MVNYLIVVINHFCLTDGEEEGEGAGLAALEGDSNFFAR